MIGYAKHFDSNKKMSFKVSDNKLLKKSKKIWEKVANLLTIKFDSEPIYGDVDKYIKTKIKTYSDRVNKNFHGQKVPKENARYKCISLKMLDSVIRVNKKYYPQTLLEECKCAIKKNKMENLINHDLTLIHLMIVIMNLIMNLVINFKKIKWCFNSNNYNNNNNNNNNSNNNNNNNNNKRLSCMVYLVMCKPFIIIIIKTSFYPFKIYICTTFLLTRLHFVRHIF